MSKKSCVLIRIGSILYFILSAILLHLVIDKAFTSNYIVLFQILFIFPIILFYSTFISKDNKTLKIISTIVGFIGIFITCLIIGLFDLYSEFVIMYKFGSILPFILLFISLLIIDTNKGENKKPKLIVKESITIKHVFQNKHISLYIIGLIILLIINVFLILIDDFSRDFKPITYISIIAFIFYFIYFILLISKVIKNKTFHLLHLIVSILVLLVTVIIIFFVMLQPIIGSNLSLTFLSSIGLILLIMILFMIFLIAPYILFIIYDSINLSKKQ
jgi:hypothetical protein